MIDIPIPMKSVLATTLIVLVTKFFVAMKNV